MGDSGFSLRRTPQGPPDGLVPDRDPGHPGDPRGDRTKLHHRTTSWSCRYWPRSAAPTISWPPPFSDSSTRPDCAPSRAAARTPRTDMPGRVCMRQDAARFEEDFRDWVQDALAWPTVGACAVPVTGAGDRPPCAKRCGGVQPCPGCRHAPSASAVRSASRWTNRAVLVVSTCSFRVRSRWTLRPTASVSGSVARCSRPYWWSWI